MESRAGSSPLRRRCSRVWQRCRQLGEIYRSLTLGVDQLESVSNPLILQQRGPRSPSERDVQALNCSVQHPRWEGRNCAHLCSTQTPCCTELALGRFLPFFFFFSSLEATLLDLLPWLHADAKDFHFPSAGREDLGRLQSASVNIPGQRLVSAKCSPGFIALGITRLSGRSSEPGI